MSQNTLERIHKRVHILNQIYEIECEQSALELAYASITSTSSQQPRESEYTQHNILEDIELRMSILEEKYNQLQHNLLRLSQR